MGDKKTYTLNEIVEENTKSFLTSLGKMSPQAERLVMGILNLDKDVIHQVKTNKTLTEKDHIQIMLAYQNYAKFKEMGEVITLAKERGMNRTQEFSKVENLFFALGELEKEGRYFFPEQVWFKDRWKGPRFPLQPRMKLKRWLVGEFTGEENGNLRFVAQEKISKKIHTYFLEIKKSDKISSPALTPGQLVEIQIYAKKTIILTE